MRTFMFPGQGSQGRGMGAALFDDFPEVTAIADRLLGYSIKTLCIDDPRRELDQTRFTQPAIYVVNALAYLKRTRGSAIKPNYLVGHSLGEINALLAAGCFDFETGLQLVCRRAELMSKASGGAMAAILGASKEEVQSVLDKHGLDQIDLANYNTPVQIVISGPREQIVKAQYAFTPPMTYCPLNTSGAFHSRLMREATRDFRDYLETLHLSDPEIPVLANVTARPYERGRVAETLANQMSSPVRWCEEIQYLLQLGAAEPAGMEFEEIGHGDVLTRLLRVIKQVSPLQVRPEANERAAAAPQTRKDDGPPREAGQGSATRPGASQKSGASTSASDRVAAWNGRYPVGTRVRSKAADYAELETATPALVLFGHRAAIYMKGYEGYFDLEEITPLAVAEVSRI